MATFCAEHEISRNTFYKIRARVKEGGQVAALEPRSRRPSSNPARIGEQVKDQAVQVRAVLESSGLDHGPISVHDRMRAMGLEEPSVAALARIFRERGVALNPTRRGWQGQLVEYAKSLGVTPITGKPGKPTTQGKNERFHQTLHRWLDKQDLAETIEELQQLVDEFDHVYNTERPHQALPGRVTPQEAWDATTPAQSPRPQPRQQSQPARWRTTTFPEHGERQILVRANGTLTINGVKFHISKTYAGSEIYAVWNLAGIIFADHNGEIITEYPWPPHGTYYVTNHKPTRNHPDKPFKNPHQGSQ